MPTLDNTRIVTVGNNGVTPLIGGAAYFAALKAKIDAMGSDPSAGEFIYIAGWWIGPDFSLDGSTLLSDLLIAKARAGVDVRVLGWVLAPEVLQNSRAMNAPGIADILGINADTMTFVNTLRTEPKLAAKACLNILAHPAGGAHMKMIVLGSNSQATGYTGGIDLQSLRLLPFWHDVQAEVSGPVVRGFFEIFQKMWEEVRRRPVVRLKAKGVTADSHSTKMPELPMRTLNSTNPNHVRAQSVITIPQMRFSSVGTIASIGGASIPKNKPLSFAPQGLFDARLALQRGIQDAKHYVYIEDQAFTSTEVFDMINAALRSNANVRVIVMAGIVDPTDTLGLPLVKLFHAAVNNHLMRSLNAGHLARLGVFSHESKVMHTKSTIVDDVWAIIGSANAMRRALYTDIEHAVAYMDEDDGRAVVAYRKQLWGVHLQIDEPDLAKALDAWFAIPFQGSGAANPLGISRVKLPLSSVTLSEEEKVLNDEIRDVNSREEWGGRLIDFYMKKFGAGLLSP